MEPLRSRIIFFKSFVTSLAMLVSYTQIFGMLHKTFTSKIPKRAVDQESDRNSQHYKVRK
jgi:hypothetical protein